MDASGSSQHGAIGRGQLLEAGLSSAAVGRLVSSGRLRPLWRGVYVVGGHPTTMLLQLMGATLLGSRPCVSHRSAAFLWRLYDETPPIEVSSKCSLNISGITSHRKTVEKGDLTEVSGIAVTPTWLERRFLRLLKRADLPGFVRKHPSDRYRSEVISKIVMTYRRLRGWQSFSR